MKRVVFQILFLLLSMYATAQSIPAKVVKEFKVNDPSLNDYYTFHEGDDVLLYGYKKKGNIYHFIVSTENYASHITIGYIPFDKTEKELKKLPSGNTPEMDNLVNDIRNDIIKRKKYEVKQKALGGQYKAVVKSSSAWISNYNKEIPSVGDTVYIIGYKKEYSRNIYALYNNKFAEVYTAYSSPFNKEFDWELMPSTDDTDVQKLLQKKKEEIRERINEEKRAYQEKALKGEIKDVLTPRYSFSTLYDENEKAWNFNKGDTVVIVGYKKVGTKYYYALYSEEEAGIFHNNNSYDIPFQESSTVKFDWLPSVDAPEVKAIIEQQQAAAAEVLQRKAEEQREKNRQAMMELIDLYKQMDPVFINESSWYSNSVGGIDEINIKVINCSPTQTIKYISFQGYFTNPVGDKCVNEIGGGYTWRCRGVGPIGPAPTTIDNFFEREADNKGTYNFDDIGFYSRTAAYIHITSVTIQYMSGKSITLTGANLNKHLKYGE